MHIYAFGSLCRGEIDVGSDVDLLLLSNVEKLYVNPQQFSAYSYERIIELWAEGNPFAWHLATEAKLIYSADQSDYIAGLSYPAPYGKPSADRRNSLML